MSQSSSATHLRIHDPDESPLVRAVREIEENVMEEFAERWDRAGWLGRLILKYRMKNEINERFERLRPRLGWLMRQHFRVDPNEVQRNPSESAGNDP